MFPTVHSHSVGCAGQEKEDCRRFATQELRISEPGPGAIGGPQESVKGVPLQHDQGRDSAHPVDECNARFGRGRHQWLGIFSLTNAARFLYRWYNKWARLKIRRLQPGRPLAWRGRPRNVDAALKVRAVFDDDTSCFHIAHQVGPGA
jgi:hypothetical protein